MIPLRDDNPTHLQPVLTLVLIGTCVLTFLWQLGLGGEGNRVAIRALGVTPAVLLGGARLPDALEWVPAPITVLTSMFLHGGWLHLAGNMLYLWVFGDNLEDLLGRVRFLLFYVVCGVAAAFAQVLPDVNSAIPMIGASGAISGVMGGYIVRYPRVPVLVVIPFIIPYTLRLPALVVLGFWFAGQLLSSMAADPSAGGVAFGAHVGGFVAGALLMLVFRPR